jgi:hypothetical protein
MTLLVSPAALSALEHASRRRPSEMRPIDVLNAEGRVVTLWVVDVRPRQWRVGVTRSAEGGFRPIHFVGRKSPSHSSNA